MISGMIDSAKNSDLNGVLVRSFIHASTVPRTNANSAVPVGELQRVPEQPGRLAAP